MTKKKKTPSKAKAKPRKAARKAVDKKPVKKAARKALKKTPAKTPKAKKAPAKPQVYAHIFDNPKNVKRVIHALVAVSAITFVLDFFVNRYVDHPWEGLFGFYAVYGFVVCVFLVLAAKAMRKVVMRKEDYYDG